MNQSIPLFKSHYSIGKSILTWEKAGSSTPTEADSIVDLAKSFDLPRVFAVEDGMSSFLEAYTNCNEAKIPLSYGVRMTVGQDAADQSEGSLNKQSKIVIMMRNSDAYARMIKIWKAANDVNHFYYEPRIDFKLLKSLWSDKDLMLCVPFYDSFLFYNLFTFGACIPDFGFTKPVFFLEDNKMWFDNYLASKIENYAGDEFETIKTQSVYYAKKNDFSAYLTLRCLTNRRNITSGTTVTIEKPEKEHMTSDSFCLENWKEQNA